MTEPLTRILNIREIFQTAFSLVLKNLKIGLLLASPLYLPQCIFSLHAIYSISLIVSSLNASHIDLESVTTQDVIPQKSSLFSTESFIDFCPLLIGIVTFSCLILVLYTSRLGRPLDLGKTLLRVVRDIVPIILKSVVLVLICLVCWAIPMAIIAGIGMLIFKLYGKVIFKCPDLSFVPPNIPMGEYSDDYAVSPKALTELGCVTSPIFDVSIGMALGFFFLCTGSLGILFMLTWGEIIIRRASYRRLWTFPYDMLLSAGFLVRALILALAISAVNLGLFFAHYGLRVLALTLLADKYHIASQIFNTVMASGFTALHILLNAAIATVIYQDTILRFELTCPPWPNLAVPLEAAT